MPCLEVLVAERYEVVGVVTQPDKPKGRGGRQAAPPVKLYAEAYGLRVLQSEKSDGFYEDALKLEPDLAVTVAFGGILRGHFLNALPRGCINVHASLLPKYRGPSPIHQALLNGDTKTGITTMLTDVGIDTGDILLSEELWIPPDMCFEELQVRLAVLGAEVLKKTIPQYLNGQIIPVAQDSSRATRTPIIRKEAGKLDFNESAQQIVNKVRALNPWPGTITELNGKVVKILGAHVDDKWTVRDAGERAESLCGEIVEVSKEAIIARCGFGYVRITRLQFQNGKEMDISACWHNIQKGWIFNSPPAPAQ